MHLKPIIRLLSSIQIVIAVLMIIPLLIAVYFGEKAAMQAFAITIILMAFFSFIGFSLSTETSRISELSQRDSYLFTSITWIISTAFGAIPLYLTKNYSRYSDAFFEIMSGFTTTGASRLVDIEHCYKSILFWRSMTNWLGGMGIVVLFVAILPVLGLGAGGFKMFGAETVGPIKGKLTSSTKKTAVILWSIYTAITFVQTTLLLFGGVPFFDAITVAFSTVSTAGFSVRNESIGAYSSAYVDAVVTVFMLIASINFSLYFKIFTGQAKEAFKDTEMRVFIKIWGFASLLGALFLYKSQYYKSFFSAFRYMSFHVASVISTTGFCNVSYLEWPTFCIMILVVMMFIGGCSGSTGGGIKVIRVITIFKSSQISIYRKIHQNGVYKMHIDGQSIDENSIFQIFTFCAIYIVTWMCGALCISLSGASIQDCLSSALLTLGNIGLGFGHEHFADYPSWCNWVFSFLMLAGRLELMTLYVTFSKSFWKN